MTQEFNKKVDGPLWFHEGELRCRCTGRLKRSDISSLLVCSQCGSPYLIEHGAGIDFNGGRGVPDLRHSRLTQAQTETIADFSTKWDFDPASVREERFRIANGWFLDRFAKSWPAVSIAEDTIPYHPSLGLPAKLRHLEAFLRDKKRILDAGCGLGNLTTMIAENACHAEVWGLDLSTAPLKWADEAPENVRLVRGDLRDSPIAGSFDLIISDGVLHHTDDTWRSATVLARKLTIGGDFLFHVYRKKAPIREFADDYLRAVMRDLDVEGALELSRALARLGKALRELNVTITVESIPELGIKAGTYDLQRFVYWHMLKAFWDDGGNEEAAMIENFDWYRPTLAHRHTEDEVMKWISESPELELAHLTPCDSGFSIHVRRVEDASS